MMGSRLVSVSGFTPIDPWARQPTEGIRIRCRSLKWPPWPSRGVHTRQTPNKSQPLTPGPNPSCARRDRRVKMCMHNFSAREGGQQHLSMILRQTPGSRVCACVREDGRTGDQDGNKTLFSTVGTAPVGTTGTPGGEQMRPIRINVGSVRREAQNIREARCTAGGGSQQGWSEMRCRSKSCNSSVRHRKITTPSQLEAK